VDVANLVSGNGPSDCTPDWTATDLASGLVERLGTDERTAHQVAVRAGHTLEDICLEWLGHEAPMRRAIELTDGNQFATPAESGEPPLLLPTIPYDFLRSATSRRSRGEIQALDWKGDPTAVLDDFSPYGPLWIEDAGV
jgi:hypothetical protein